ncbi:ATV_collapsed_G0019160.mRNA.1.CDS.1 [Saccharomyces cerevisiae]|nr:ATV_collapsed_G0019160.mRNA.1.CDS.1 [Saccharomyces cerevisiae]
MPPKEAPKKWKAPKGPKPTHRKNKNKLELGRAIKYARQKENAIEYLPDGEMRFTTDKHEANWVKLRSVTQESALDEFLSTAALADKDFTADRHSNVKIIRMDSGNDSATSQGFSMTNEQPIYGIHIQTKSRDEGGNGDIPTAQELLVAYARARGYMTQGYGSADEPRASRYILKDYVNGKLLYVNPPPHLEDDTPYTREECEEFNKDLYVFDRLPDTRKEQVQNAAKAKGIDIVDLARDLNQLTFSAHTGGDAQKEAKSVTHGGKQAALYNAAEDLDRDFFKMNNVEGRLSTPFHKVQNSSAGKRHNKKNKSKNAKSKVFSIENN